MSSRLRLLYPLVVLVALLAFAAAASAGSTSPKETSLEVVASGLDNPRGLDISRSGSLYVAEAGRGGTEACVPSPEGEGEACIGDTGAVTKVWRGGQRRVATGLPSVAGPDGSAATGPHDIYLAYGGGYIPVGLAGTEGARVRESLAAKAVSLRRHEAAEAETRAQEASERMSLPVAVLLFGFLVFLGYPALARVLSGI